LSGGIDTYAYANDAPTSYIDPDGLNGCKPTWYGAECDFSPTAPVWPSNPTTVGQPGNYPAMDNGGRSRDRESPAQARSRDSSETCPPAACSKAIKLLEQVDRLAQKLGKKLSPKRLAELQQKIADGTISSDDLPADIRREFPREFEGKSLNEIRRLCGKSR
jgi:anti-sigma28 factor (negative regulator of flagellin synthesis)